MEEKRTLFDYLGHIFCMYGVTVLIMIILCSIFGEDAKDFSDMFRLGEQGLSLATLLQFFSVVVIMEVFRIVFFTDGIIKRLSITMRTVLMFVVDVLVLSFYIYRFGWFPIDMPEPWIMFLICFFVSVGVSTMLMSIREKMMNKKMEEGLSRLKQKWEEEENGK